MADRSRLKVHTVGILAGADTELGRDARAPLPGVGDVVDGRYRLLRDLGRGASGAVYEARHLFTGRSVAVKLLLPQERLEDHVEMRERLKREAQMLASIRHPGVVDVLDGGFTDAGVAFIVLEMLEGRTLEGILAARRPLSVADSVAVCLQLCDALGAVHRAGVLHRDIKPGNIILVRGASGEERAKLVDFGIARMEDPDLDSKLTAAGTVLGSPAYMAPERLLGQGDDDVRTDVFSLGATLYECLGGKPPLWGTYQEIVIQVAGPAPIPPLQSVAPDVPEALAQVVDRAVAKSPSARFGTVGDLAFAIEHAVPESLAPQRAARPGHARRAGGLGAAAQASPARALQHARAHASRERGPRRPVGGHLGGRTAGPGRHRLRPGPAHRAAIRASHRGQGRLGRGLRAMGARRRRPGHQRDGPRVRGSAPGRARLGGELRRPDGRAQALERMARDTKTTLEFPRVVPIDPAPAPEGMDGYVDESPTQRGAPTAPVAASSDRPLLTVVVGLNAGEVFSLDRDETLIGRGRDSHVVLDDAGISRRHARIMRTSGKYVLEDLGSANGVFVNGRKATRAEIATGDRVRIGPAFVLRFRLIAADEEALARKLYEGSTRDALTGIYNRKYATERLSVEVSYALRHKTSFGVALFDLDHFKRVNDEHGHQAGDGVLRVVAAQVQKAIRAEDVLARYGGEEFVVLVRGVDPRGVSVLAERIRGSVERLSIPFESRVLRATVSVGIASLSECGSKPTADALVALADERLYEAKESGRNRVCGGSLAP